MYSLFIPMEWNMEGFIDRHGMPVFRTPENPIKDIQDELIYQGVLSYWENEVEALKSDPDSLNEFYRQFPRTENHAFRDEAENSLFNLTKIYQQIDFNDSVDIKRTVRTGNFVWKDGVRDTEVVWMPSVSGKMRVSWIPEPGLRNNIEIINGRKYPGNKHIGAFGCDSYDISGVVGGNGSKGSLHGLTTMTFDNAPSNQFFLEYVARPQTSEMFYENVLMALVFYGMPVLVENNKPRLLYI